MRTLRVCAAFLLALGLVPLASAQSVISTHSGVIYYLDGAVYVGDQPVQSSPGKFPVLPQDADLRTAQGHVEVVLTPGVFLRLGESSSIHMLSNDLANTRVELQEGSAIVDSGEPAADTGVTLVFRDWEVHSDQAGTYRIDSAPPRLWVIKGNAQVVARNGGPPITVDEGSDLPLAAVLRPELSMTEPSDDLAQWARGRGDSITADDTITQQIDSDPGSAMPGADAFSYFPFVGVPPLGLSYYSSVLPVQPGFYSMYLPGYTYAPPIVLLPLMGRRGGPVPVLPLRGGIYSGVGGIVRPGIGGIVQPGYPVIPRPMPRPLVPVIVPRAVPAPGPARPVAPRPVAPIRR